VTEKTRPLLVGEANPRGSAPEWALHPEPPSASGGRLARILGLSPDEYLSTFRRVNLSARGWRLPEARAAAEAIVLGGDPGPLVLLGAKVCSAFGIPFRPFTFGRTRLGPYARDRVARVVAVGILLHPSGLSRYWSDPDSKWNARRVIRYALEEAKT